MMAQHTTHWTRELVDRKRMLHSTIDLAAGRAPAEAARARLALYTVTYEFNEGLRDAALVAEAFDDLEHSLSRVSTAA
jgi:hypothetical protein